MQASGLHETADEPYVMLVTPSDASSGGEGAARERVAAGVGLLVALFGRNVVLHQVFQNEGTYPDAQLTAYGADMLNPDSFPTPRLTAARMARVPAASAALDDMPEAELGRTILSLRWFEQTQQTQPSADSLLQAWIAIEALVMDGTNIAPIGRSPGALYGLEPERAKAKYMIGRIYDLRGRIVHGTSRGHLDHRLPASEWTRRFDDCPSGARCPRHHRDR